MSILLYLVERFLQHLVLTKDDELKAGQEDPVCVEGAANSVMLVSCDDNSKQWKISQVKPQIYRTD